MLVVISPAKKLDETPLDLAGVTAPDFQQDAIKLARAARRLSLADLRRLMDISQDLAKLNKTRFRDFVEEVDAPSAKPAMYSFAGDTYTGLDAGSLDPDEVAYAQDHLRILSGLYGLLRPMDAIQPYRLEMGTKMANPRGKSLYDFWGSRIGEQLSVDL